jgi:selenocysteine lyase/cysteine desulfurase
MNNLEIYFSDFRKNIVGINQTFNSPFGQKQIIYADWVASGRLYEPIEKKLLEDFGPFVANTHTETTVTGTLMTNAYHEARHIIKRHVNASENDVLIFAGYGMTAAINKFQRLLGLRVPEQLQSQIKLEGNDRPVVILTHMEHHSNQTSWLETLAEVVVLEPDENGLVDLNKLEEVLKHYSERKLKIGSFTAASNVTGIMPDLRAMAKLMHEYDGLCFADFAMAAPYIEINMHPDDPAEKLDAIFFSPHKFLGGPGSSGILIFDSKLYERKIHDLPGG